MSRKVADISLSDLGSFLAVVLSIIAICVSLIEANTTRTASRAQAWPYLATGTSYNSEGFGYYIENKGVGPALLERTEITYEGAPVTDLDALILDILGPEDAFSYDRYRTSEAEGVVVSAGEEVTLFAVNWDPASRRLSQALGQGLAISLCYCSVYGECWTAELGQTRPQEQKTCS